MNIVLKAATAIVAGLRKLIAGLVVVFFAYMIVAVLVQIAGRLEVVVRLVVIVHRGEARAL